MTRPQRECQRFNKRNNTFACASCFFIYFFVVTAWLQRENAEIPHFMENVNKQHRNLISLSELGYGPLEFNFRRVRLHFTKYVGRNNCERDWKMQIHFQAIFLLPSRHWILKSLLTSEEQLQELHTSDMSLPTVCLGSASEWLKEIFLTQPPKKHYHIISMEFLQSFLR